MRFELPNATAAMNNAVAAVGADGDAWDVVGVPLDKPVDELVSDYDRKLELELAPRAGDKRLEVCGLHWGRIGKDVARLKGLAAAIENVAGVIKSGKDQLAHDWKGEAYDAFRAAIEKVETTLGDYSSAVKGAAENLDTALASIQTEYGRYRDDTTGTHLNFAELSPPDEWRKMTGEDADRLAQNCESYHGGVTPGLDQNCTYNDDQQVAIINERFVNNRLLDRLQSWDCTDDAGVVIDQYETTVRDAEEERSAISGKINNWYRATDQLKSDVDGLFQEALKILRFIAETKPFQSLSIVGADGTAPAGSAPPGGGGYSGSGYSGGGYSGGESVPDIDAPSAMSPEPEPTPEPEPSPEPEPVAAEPGTVEIKDADRTISLSSPTGEGHVKVTVQDETGASKSYDLDFEAASGMPADPSAESPTDTEHVPAGTNGKCVIQDGQVTITAERSLFDNNTITFTVDDGAGKPTTYTVDFTAEAESQQPPATPTPSPPDEAAPPEPESAAATPASATPTPADGAADPVGRSAAASGDGAADPADKPAAALADPAESPAREGSAEVPTAVKADSAEEPATPAAPTVAENSAGPTAEESEDPATPSANADEARTAGETTTQSDPSGRLSGVLVSDPPEPGEAGLASAADGEPAGAAGSAMPMMAAAGAAGAGVNGGSEAAGRAGTGWSVHGDLFDSGDPVHSMHGVLGEEDLKSQ